MNWRDEVIHASDCRCKECMPDYCPHCEKEFNKAVERTITEAEEKAISEFIDAQFEADVLAEAEELEVL